MRILVTGSTGLLGRALVKRLACEGEVIGLSRHLARVEGEAQHLVCDLTDADQARTIVGPAAVDLIIHAQALADLDQCEDHPLLAQRMNVEAVEHLCRVAEERTIGVIMISTNCVFDGAKDRPYDEADAPYPISVYGRTKVAGERLLLRSPRNAVVRTSLLFGAGARRENFCETVIRGAREGRPVEAFVDQVVSPTSTEDMAEGLVWLLRVLQGHARGTPHLYHLVNAGTCSRVELANRIVELLGGSLTLVKPIRMADQGRPAKRPANATLTSRWLTAVTGRSLRSWDEALQAYLKQRHLLN